MKLIPKQLYFVMKLFYSTFLLLGVAPGTFAGSGVHDSPHSAPSAEDNRESLRAAARRRAEGDTQTVPLFEDEPEVTWFPAQSLEFFKNIDPSVFEWINPSEIEAGNITCGFLHADLGTPFWQEPITYPKVKVYFCVRFAENQPAPKGNLFVHCGGPGTGTACIYNADRFGLNNLENYNIISIDQRGLGRSQPSFEHPECAQFSNEEIFNVDPANEESIMEFAQKAKQRVFDCWGCKTCGFNLEATQTDGSVWSFNFLEYAGTHQLAEDMDQFRQAIGAPKLSIWGTSYGSSVGATYATLFSDKVDKFIIDSTVPRRMDLWEFSREMADGMNHRIDYMVYSCTAQNIIAPGTCPVEDMPTCINDLNSVLSETTVLEKRDFLSNAVTILMESPEQSEEFCDAAAAGDKELVESIYAQYFPQDSSSNRRMEVDPESSQPSETELDDFWIIFALDMYNHPYNDKDFARRIMKLNEDYPGAGTGNPALYAMIFYHAGFYWPKSVPLPPFGNPTITGIISAQLYDMATPYSLAQSIKEGFPSASLLTSRGYYHVLFYSPADPNIVYEDEKGNVTTCQKQLNNYLELGYVPFVDGAVCGSPFPSDCNLKYALGSQNVELDFTSYAECGSTLNYTATVFVPVPP